MTNQKVIEELRRENMDLEAKLMRYRKLIAQIMDLITNKVLFINEDMGAFSTLKTLDTED